MSNEASGCIPHYASKELPQQIYPDLLPSTHLAPSCAQTHALNALQDRCKSYDLKLDQSASANWCAVGTQRTAFSLGSLLEVADVFSWMAAQEICKNGGKYTPVHQSGCPSNQTNQ